MKNELFPDDGLVDYSSGAYRRTYNIDDCKYYAAFHHELYHEEDGLEATGRVFVVLLHPSGLHSFFMKMGEDENWIVDEAKPVVDKNDNVVIRNVPFIPILIGQKMVEWLGDQICSRGM